MGSSQQTTESGYKLLLAEDLSTIQCQEVVTRMTAPIVRTAEENNEGRLLPCSNHPSQQPQTHPICTSICCRFTRRRRRMSG